MRHVLGKIIFAPGYASKLTRQSPSPNHRANFLSSVKNTGPCIVVQKPLESSALTTQVAERVWIFQNQRLSRWTSTATWRWQTFFFFNFSVNSFKQNWCLIFNLVLFKNVLLIAEIHSVWVVKTKNFSTGQVAPLIFCAIK